MVTFPLSRGSARGYLARSVSQTGDGALVVDAVWHADVEHHPRCDELAARGLTALVVELRDERGGQLPPEAMLATLLEGIDYLGFHPSVRGRQVFVDGDPALVEALLAARDGTDVLAKDP